MSVQAVLLADGRLHLQHGPIDCLCRAWGEADEIEAAYGQAVAAFPAILPALCDELVLLRTPLPSPCPLGAVAGAMHAACLPFAANGFMTPMAAVAGAVADHVLVAMTKGRNLARAFVNNGGDIALHLTPGAALRCGLVSDLAAPALDATMTIKGADWIRGIATSGSACKGNGGRSFSRGIADSVTVLADTAARADAAATVIANAVDLPGHAAIVRRPAAEIDPDSDLGVLPVTWEVGLLTLSDIDGALDAGRVVADALLRDGLIAGAALVLRGRFAVSGARMRELETA